MPKIAASTKSKEDGSVPWGKVLGSLGLRSKCALPATARSEYPPGAPVAQSIAPEARHATVIGLSPGTSNQFPLNSFFSATPHPYAEVPTGLDPIRVQSEIVFTFGTP